MSRETLEQCLQRLGINEYDPAEFRINPDTKTVEHMGPESPEWVVLASLTETHGSSGEAYLNVLVPDTNLGLTPRLVGPFEGFSPNGDLNV